MKRKYAFLRLTYVIMYLQLCLERIRIGRWMMRFVL